MTGPQLKSLRKRLGFTQAQLAGVLFVDRRTVSRWERGDHGIEEHTLPAILLAELRRFAGHQDAGAGPSRWTIADHFAGVRARLHEERPLDALELLLHLVTRGPR